MSAPRVRGYLAGAAVASALALTPMVPAAAFSSSGPGGAVPKPAPATAASTKDLTVTAKARTSLRYRKTIPLATWVAAPKARAIAKRESGGNCRAVSPGGLYRGKWQMSAAFWGAYGGKAYAQRADRATCAEQDKVAYRGWLASWWHPWGG